jgi:hypothetical protein
MELRRSRRLAGKEPEVIPMNTTEILVKVQPAVVHRGRAVGICNGTLSILGSVLATLTLVRAVVAVACAPGHCLF